MEKGRGFTMGVWAAKWAWLYLGFVQSEGRNGKRWGLAMGVTNKRVELDEGRGSVVGGANQRAEAAVSCKGGQSG